jgi:lysozyme family protein
VNAWPLALEMVLRHEGGFADHPQDPGSATFAGVSLRAVNALDADGDGELDFDFDKDGDVDRTDIKALAHHPEKVAAFYLENYWNPIRGNQLPPRIALLVFDAAVHHGVKAATVMVQRVVGVKQDGVFGAQTVAAVWRTGDASERLLTERALLMTRIVAARPASAVFLAGWFRRLFALASQVSALRAA